MDYYQGIVSEYLCAKKSVFVTHEYEIQRFGAKWSDKGMNWIVDVFAVDLAILNSYCVRCPMLKILTH